MKFLKLFQLFLMIIKKFHIYLLSEKIIEIKYSYSYNKEIIEFDIKNNVFIENDNDSDDYYNYMREEEERRYYENEGYRDAYDGNPDAQWNTD